MSSGEHCIGGAHEQEVTLNHILSLLHVAPQLGPQKILSRSHLLSPQSPVFSNHTILTPLQTPCFAS